jgi:hypothetical protein
MATPSDTVVPVPGPGGAPENPGVRRVRGRPGSRSPPRISTDRRAGTAPAGSAPPETGRTCGSPSTRSAPRIATTGTRPAATIPGQAEAPVPGPARHVHRTMLPEDVSPVGLRAQRPPRGGRKDLPVQRGSEVPLRPPAQAAPSLEGGPASRRHVPVDYPVRAPVRH